MLPEQKIYFKPEVIKLQGVGWGKTIASSRQNVRTRLESIKSSDNLLFIFFMIINERQIIDSNQAFLKSSNLDSWRTFLTAQGEKSDLPLVEAGSGADATVYRVEGTTTTYALKIAKVGSASLIRQEARVLGLLKDVPSIAHIINTHQASDNFLVLEWADGDELDVFLDHNNVGEPGSLQDSENSRKIRVQLVQRWLTILKNCMAKDVYPIDIKFGNAKAALIEDGPQLMMYDFGVAKIGATATTAEKVQIVEFTNDIAKYVVKMLTGETPQPPKAYDSQSMQGGDEQALALSRIALSKELQTLGIEKLVADYLVIALNGVTLFGSPMMGKEGVRDPQRFVTELLQKMKTTGLEKYIAQGSEVESLNAENSLIQFLSTTSPTGENREQRLQRLDMARHLAGGIDITGETGYSLNDIFSVLTGKVPTYNANTDKDVLTSCGMQLAFQVTVAQYLADVVSGHIDLKKDELKRNLSLLAQNRSDGYLVFNTSS